jgi:hypothetical protein
VLVACGRSGGTIEGANMEALPEGKNLHDHIIKIGYVFDKISGRDVVSWTTIISRYVQNAIFS